MTCMVHVLHGMRGIYPTLFTMHWTPSAVPTHSPTHPPRQVYLAVAPSIDSGAYYLDSNLAPSSAAAQDDALALQLWDMSERLCA